MSLKIKLFIIIIITILVKFPISVTSKRNQLLIGDENLPGLLYPQENEYREVKSLDGLWSFGVFPSINRTQYDELIIKWIQNDFWKKLSTDINVMQMPVPSSYNDIVTSAKLRDYVGAVWYARNFYVPRSWRTKKVFIRFGSVNYYAKVWVNDQLLITHEIGHLPFEAEIAHFLNFGEKNGIIVVVDNILSEISIPQGKLIESKTGNVSSWIQSYTFDFFNYAGIHRPVLLHTKPIIHIDDITVVTDISGNTGIVKYIITTNINNNIPFCMVNIQEAKDNSTTESQAIGCTGTIEIPNVKLWWPRGMNSKPAFMYRLKITVFYNSKLYDIYRLPIGIRTLKWTNTSLLINNKPVYMRGFGRHEDSVLRGRGLDLVTMTRDYELLKWVGANAYRTSHYPYSDEVMDMADRQGFLIIDECPSVNTDSFSSELAFLHKASIAQLIRRDKNRPSVIIWSIANEPRIWHNPVAYFDDVSRYAKNLETTRPITAAFSIGPWSNSVGQFFDIICYNKYNAWYQNAGRLDMITENVVMEAEAWHAKFNKPVIMSEYGADTIPGLHELPELLWSEEYQALAFSQHFKAFDRLRNHSWFIGELIWNFADFRTPPGINRAGGNKKGIFTRNREPKMVARLVRKRYHNLAFLIDKQRLEQDQVDDFEYYY